MRFKWRSHLMVTALASIAILPFTGCSSSQQQATDEVEASQQQQGGEESADAEASDTQTEGQEEVATNNASTQESTGEEAVNETGTGDEVVTNNAVIPNNASSEGDLQEIVQEMGANGNAQQEAAAAATPTESIATEDAGAVPPPANNHAAAPVPAPTNAAPAAPMDAGQPAAVGGLPEMGSKMPYVVEVGDTLGKVATKVYGDQKRWREISGLTGLSNPNHIFPGDIVYFSLDEKSAQFAANYVAQRRGKEMVQDGDTLASIAKRVYGSSKAWRHLWRQNDHIDNPDHLSAGMTIYYVEKEFIKTAKNDKTFNKATAFKTVKTFKSVSYVKTPAFAFSV